MPRFLTSAGNVVVRMRQKAKRKMLGKLKAANTSGFTNKAHKLQVYQSYYAHLRHGTTPGMQKKIVQMYFCH